MTQPKVPVISNITARPLDSVATIKEELVQQLTAPVRWVDSVRYMIEQGVDTFAEIGPGDVLVGLIRRIDRGVRRLTIGDPAGVVAATHQFTSE